MKRVIRFIVVQLYCRNCISFPVLQFFFRKLELAKV